MRQRRSKWRTIVAGIVLAPVLARAGDLPSPEYRFIETFGSKQGIHPPKLLNRRASRKALGAGDFPWGIGAPGSVAVDGANGIWITDSATRSIHIFGASGGYREIRRVGDTALQQPSGIVMDRTGRIYVSDAVAGNVFVFHPDGAFDRALIPRKSTERVLEGPGAIATSEDGAVIYVLDPPRNAIVALNREGEVNETIALPPELTQPTNISVIDNQIWVLGDQRHKVESFTPAGAPRGELRWDGVIAPTAFAFDPVSRRFLVADPRWMVIRIFDEEGRNIGVFGSQGDGVDQMQRVDSLYVDARGRVYVIDSHHGKVLVFAE